MIASVHLAAAGSAMVIRALRRPPAARSQPGLRWAATMLTAPLSRSLVAKPDLHRIARLAFWDDEQALDAFLASPAAAPLAGGWHVRLAPVRASGDWPGLTDQPMGDPVDGPAVAVTLGRLRLSQTGRFLRASARAEAAALDAPGLLWGLALACPPLVATCSAWRDTSALAAYAYRARGHADAVAAQQRRPFHQRSAFIRFRPYDSTGALEAGPAPSAAVSG
ncbi:MAG: spheroidene monooxygenase [Actinobacteria bacterium]|nr:spheroidene monooxygenase [Actinomycetota bacterium]